MTMLFSIMALCVIFIIVNLMEKLDDFMDRQAPYSVIAKYYLYFLPEIIKLLTPVAVLLSVLFTVGRLSQSNEITAMKSAGRGLYRLMVPFVIIASLNSAFNIYFCGWVVPNSVQQKTLIEQKYLNEGIIGGPIYNLYFRDTPTKNVIMQYYNADEYYGAMVAIESYSDESSPRMIERIEAAGIRWDTLRNKWLLENVIHRKYNNGKIDVQRMDTIGYSLNITHAKLARIKMKTEEMSFDELKEYIDMLKNGGKDVRKQMIEYYGNYAFPFASLIVIFFGVPFASVKRRGGIAVQIGAAMVISFIYIMSLKFSQTIGYTANWDPIVSAWTANVIFLFFGLIVLFKTKT